MPSEGLCENSRLISTVVGGGENKEEDPLPPTRRTANGIFVDLDDSDDPLTGTSGDIPDDAWECLRRRRSSSSSSKSTLSRSFFFLLLKFFDWYLPVISLLVLLA
jgi:hypothetical protein